MANDADRGARIYGADNVEMIRLLSIERAGGELVLKGKIFGSMPMTAKLRAEEARAVLRLLDIPTLLFILTLPFRRAA